MKRCRVRIIQIINEQYEPSFNYAIWQKLEPEKAKAFLEKIGDQNFWINFAGAPYESYPVLPFYIPYLDIMGDPEIDFQERDRLDMWTNEFFASSRAWARGVNLSSVSKVRQTRRAQYVYCDLVSPNL